jgi:oxygen-independent coproporphyrinogen-3 oxidase
MEQEVVVPAAGREALIKKYDVPVPRYTSYPTVPYWNPETFTVQAWQQAVKRCFDETNQASGISLYLHLPFCESLCTYCACNTRITRNHSVEQRYIQALLKEWEQYRVLLGETPVIRELHLGGGTPTFFSPENLDYLLTALLSHTIIHPHREFSVEGHPNNTTEAHLRVLHRHGFRRVSYGVQDLQERVQRAINRIQPFEKVQQATDTARALGYESVNFDLVYGLPYQTPASVHDTVERIIQLKPDRIAFYSYAHVPWLRPGQRGYEDADLPTDVVKRQLYETGKQLLLDAGYVNIGMDHFALPDDALALAHDAGTLHRNFMGYTTTNTRLLIGLGASSISDAYYAYAQNEKQVEAYYEKLDSTGLAVVKGHVQNDDDMLIRSAILDLACRGVLSAEALGKLISADIERELDTLVEEGLVVRSEAGLSITDFGNAFIRNICSVFDQYLKARQTRNIFSKAI